MDLTKTPPTAQELGQLCARLGVSPREILRTKDPAYEELGLGSARKSDDQLLKAMAAHPGLIQRPIAVRGGKAVVARPVERLADLLR